MTIVRVALACLVLATGGVFLIGGAAAASDLPPSGAVASLVLGCGLTLASIYAARALWP
jgi:hypothetical protein